MNLQYSKLRTSFSKLARMNFLVDKEGGRCLIKAANFSDLGVTHRNLTVLSSLCLDVDCIITSRTIACVRSGLFFFIFTYR